MPAARSLVLADIGGIPSLYWTLWATVITPPTNTHTYYLMGGPHGNGHMSGWLLEWL